MSKTAKIWEKLNKEQGGASFFRADEPIKSDFEGIPFPSLSLGAAIGSFELPFGRIALLYGAEGSGKSMISYLMIAEAQKKYPDADCVLIDTESALSRPWCAQLGIDLKRLIIIDTNDGNDIMSSLCGRYSDKGKKNVPGILDLVEAGELNVKLIVLDSIADMIPTMEKGRNFNDMEMAALPKFINRSFRSLRPMLSKANVAMVCVNHLRASFNGSPQGTFPGGFGLRHSSDIIVCCRASNAADSILVNEKKEKIGHLLSCTAEKTRFGANRRKATTWLKFTEGIIRKSEELANVGHAFGVIERPNNLNWIYNGQTIKGKENFYTYLDKNPDVAAEIFNKIKELKASGLEPTMEMGDGGFTELDEPKTIIEEESGEEG